MQNKLINYKKLLISYNFKVETIRKLFYNESIPVGGVGGRCLTLEHLSRIVFQLLMLLLLLLLRVENSVVESCCNNDTCDDQTIRKCSTLENPSFALTFDP
jgi:hypothetical protein